MTGENLCSGSRHLLLLIECSKVDHRDTSHFFDRKYFRRIHGDVATLLRLVEPDFTNGKSYDEDVHMTCDLFTTTVTVIDDDTATDMATATALVGGIGLTPSGHLQIIGTVGRNV